MKLTIGPSVMRSYKRLPYKAWHALAEFVDNSTQNYFNHRSDLDQAYAAEGLTGMTIRIVYDREQGVIRISDDGFGMDETDLERALMVGNPPEDPSGRSRYGLGMKMAACWFGNKWSIVTKKLGSTTEYTVLVDVEAAADGDGDVVMTRVDDLPPDQHYTRIEISEMNGKLQGRTLGKTKAFIGSMYRLDIESGYLAIEWDGVALDPKLDLDFLVDREGVEYRKTFEFDVDGKSASGWYGVLGRGSRAKAGFSIVYQGRMIKTWPEAWRPAEIFGQEGGRNDLINQRLVGELVLDSFEISHTKDDILWERDEEDVFQDKLKEEIGDYLTVARTPFKDQPLPPVAIDHAVDEINRELNSGELRDLIENELPSPETIEADDRALIDETDQTQPPITATLTFASSDVEIIGIVDSTKSPNDPYVVYETSADNKIIVVINLMHPHVQSLAQNELDNHFRHCIYDALAEWRATRQAAPLDAGTVKRWKDQFLRVGVAIELNDHA